jgi:hypothetical protein
MKITAVYDQQGNILAASVAGEDSDQPIAAEGEHTADFEVDEELDIADCLEQFQVDVKTGTLQPR